MYWRLLGRDQKFVLMLMVVAVAILGGLYLAARASGSRSELTYRSPTPTSVPTYATVSARDETGALLPGGSVNVWSNYETRSQVVGKASDGERVEILRRSGEGVRIRLAGGAEGWVSAWFVHPTP